MNLSLGYPQTKRKTLNQKVKVFYNIRQQNDDEVYPHTHTHIYAPTKNLETDYSEHMNCTNKNIYITNITVHLEEIPK